METTFNKISSKVFTDPDTGAEIFPYEVDGKLCPYILYNSPIGKQFAGYVLILKDIDFAISCFQKLIGNEIIDKELRTAILFSGIFTYMKCFAAGSERGTHLHVTLFKSTSNEYLKLHKEIDEFRDKYLAHASTQTYETSSIALYLNPNESIKELITMSVAAKYVTDKDDSLKNYIELMEKVKELVSVKMKKRMEALKKEIATIDIDKLYDSAKIPDRSDFREIELGKYREKLKE